MLAARCKPFSLMNASSAHWLQPALLRGAILDSFRKLSPASLVKMPVIALTAVGACLTTLAIGQALYSGHDWVFPAHLSLWLWFTVLFANFSEAVAEGRGRAQADALRRTRTHTQAKRLRGDQIETVPAAQLRRGDVVVCEAGDIIPADGEAIEGIASVDESAITGESAPVIRESGGDRCAVTGGTRVISDRIVVRVTSEPGNTFVDRMIQLVEGAKRQRTPNEIALGILLVALSLIFLLAVATLSPLATFVEAGAGQSGVVDVSLPTLVALFVCLIPTTIGGLLSAIGISGIDRLIRRNVIATSGRAVEAAGDIDVLMLDKTGTITLGNRQASEFIPAPGVSTSELVEAALLASLADETPEGRSIVTLARTYPGVQPDVVSGSDTVFVPFTAQTRMSGVDFASSDAAPSGGRIRKGAPDSVRRWVESLHGAFPRAVTERADAVSRAGATPLAVAKDSRVLGLICLKDVVKAGLKERFSHLRSMGIRTVMITGDNPLTAAAIAAEAGVDDFLAQATPEMKLARIREEQAKGHLVAMTGDGTNDAPALAQADVGVAMNTGTQAAREAGNMVDLDSNPTKLIEIVEIGKQLLMTRGALTTFSVANDLAKYFAILPAMFAGLYALSPSMEGPLAALNIMNLTSSQSAILSAVIFNALIIVVLIPLALKGVQYRPIKASSLLLRNALIYGVGGLIAPFIGIKLIDLTLTALGLA